ncbi:MAG: InlB B-repeat-containing protein [Gaiellales bacterium]
MRAARLITLSAIACVVVGAAAASPASARAATRTQARVAQTRVAAMAPLDYLSLLGYGVQGFYALKACGTPAGCFASFELQKLYEMDVKLDRLVTGMGQLQTSVDELTRVTNAGFRQLNVDLKESRYVLAEESLSELTSGTEEAFHELQRTANPELSAKQRTDAYRNFITYAARLDGKTYEILQKVGGDPATPQSQIGALPAAWDLLLANETRRQQSTIGAMPAFLPWQVQAQMASLGNLWIDRELKLAQVLATYATVTAASPADAKRRSDDVLRRFNRGAPSHPSIPNQVATLPKRLPVGTGLFTGSVTGDADLPGLVIGNFSDWRAPDDTGTLISADAGWALHHAGYSDPNGTVVAATDARWSLGSFRYDAASGELSQSLGGGRQCLYVNRAADGERVRTDGCWKALRQWSFVDGALRLRGHPLCMAILEYPQGWNHQRAAWVGLRACTGTPEQMWFVDGPAPTWFAPLDPRVGSSGFAGSPRGDNPDGSGPWPAAWRYPTEAWMRAVGASVRIAGTTAEALARVFALPSVDPDTRILPPYIRTGYSSEFDARRLTFALPMPDYRCAAPNSLSFVGVASFDDIDAYDGWICRGAGPTPASFVTKVQPCDYEYVKYRTADPTRTRADGSPVTCDTTLAVTVESGPGDTGLTRNATGSVAIEPLQSSCAATCTQTFAVGTTALLIADPGIGSRFAGWSGACGGTDDDCVVSMQRARAVTARFVPAADVALAVDPAPHGRVTGVPGGIDCGAECSATLRYNQPVTLTAVPDAGYRLAHWTGACAGSEADCTLIVTAASTAIGAVFVPVDRPTPAPPAPGPDGPPVPHPTAGPNPPRPYIGPNPRSTLALTQLRASRRVFRPGLGTVITYRLNENADVTMTFTLVGYPKVRHVYRLRRGRKGGDAGRNYVYLSGRVGKRDARLGTWRMSIRATNRNGSSRLLKLPLRVVAQ